MSISISVITATYNREDTIENVIKSVQLQTFPAFEHLIQDGGSTDETLPLIRRLTNSRTHLVSEKDGGIYDAINKGIKRASGAVIGLMHSDDFFASETILAKVAAAFEQSSIDGVYGDLEYVSATDPNRIIRHWRAGPYTPERLKWGWMPPHPTLYLRREIFTRWGEYDTSYQIAADYDAMLRWLVRGQIKLAYIPQVMVKMRIGGESNRSLGRVMQKSREDLRAIRTNGIGGLGTLVCKNTRKLGQFLERKT